MKTRYFVLSAVKTLDEPIPEGSVVGGRWGPDYIAHTHEMNRECDCRFCVAHFAAQSSDELL